MNLSEYVESIKSHPDFGPAYTYHRHLPPVEASVGAEIELHPKLRRLLGHLGIENLYKHQVEALQ